MTRRGEVDVFCSMFYELLVASLSTRVDSLVLIRRLFRRLNLAGTATFSAGHHTTTGYCTTANATMIVAHIMRAPVMTPLTG